ncbi:MAG: efflux transporter periplasmic adaptor subunit [Rhodospirillaceae bacterium]|nr:efflux transporter periplasmic adaptor subunit [Rhodospirillaceae bacterium]
MRQVIILVILAAIGGTAWYFRADLPLIGSMFSEEQATASGGSQRPPTPVDVALARADTVTITQEAVGTTRANEAVTITSKVRGLVTKINFEEGQQVEEGRVLVEFEANEERAAIEEQQAQLVMRRAELTNARQLYERATQLLATNNVPAARVDELKAQLDAAEAAVNVAQAAIRAAQARYQNYRIVAPFSGKLGFRSISLGALIEPGTEVTTLDDLTPIKLDFQVPERNMADITVGQEVSAQTAAYPERVFFGTVTSIDTRVDSVTRAVQVRAEIANEDGFLRPGLFMNVTLGVRARENAVIVPEEALVAEGNARYLFVVQDGVAKQVFVELGQRLPGEVEIVNGVQAGDVVVTGGSQKLRDGAPVAPREGPATS